MMMQVPTKNDDYIQFKASAQQVGFFNIRSIGSGRVLKVIPGIRSDSGTRWALYKALLKLIIIHVQF